MNVYRVRFWYWGDLRAEAEVNAADYTQALHAGISKLDLGDWGQEPGFRVEIETLDKKEERISWVLQFPEGYMASWGEKSRTLSLKNAATFISKSNAVSWAEDSGNPVKVRITYEEIPDE